MRKLKGIEETIRKVLTQFPNVMFAFLYGSYLKGHSIPLDIDIAIYVKKYKIFLKTELGKANEVKKRLFPLLLLKPDVKVLNGAPVSFQVEVCNTGKFIYCLDEEFFTDYLEELSHRAIQTQENRLALEGVIKEVFSFGG